MKQAKNKAKRLMPLKQSILLATKSILLKDGYDNLTMRKIAAVLGYSPTTLYNHFKNKDDIIFHMCDSFFAKLAETLINSVSEEDSPESKIRKCMVAYIKFGLDNPDSYHIAFMMSLSDENGYSFVEKGSNGMRAYEFILSLIGEIYDQPDIAAQTFWNMAHGIVSNLIMNRHFQWADNDILINTAADALISGLRRQKQ